MKKILSALLVFALTITMCTTMVFAADCNFALTIDKTAVVPGDVVTLKIGLDSNPGIAGYKIQVAFDEDVFERTTITYVNSDDEEVTEDVKTSWGSPTINDAQEGKTIMSWSATGNKTSKTILTMCYAVKADAVNGTDYTFEVTCPEAANAEKASVTIGSATTDAITVSGGADPAPTGTSTKTVYAEETYALSKETFDFGSAYDFAKKYNVVVKYNNAETKTYGWSWKNNLGIDGDGEVTGKVKFGVKIIDPSTYDATKFTFELDEVE